MPVSGTVAGPKDSLRGKEFLIVKKPSMVPAFEVLGALEDYLVLSSEEVPNIGKGVLPADPSDLAIYNKYSERRRPYIKNEDEVQLPGHIRRLYGQVVDCLRGPEWALSPIDPRFSNSRNEILHELTTIGLAPAGWYYVVDNLPTDVLQLRVALLVIMGEKMNKEWKDQASVKLKRIAELVSRLRFLMQLSRKVPQTRMDLFNQLAIPEGVPLQSAVLVTEPLPSVSHESGSSKAPTPMRCAVSTYTEPPTSGCSKLTVYPAEMSPAPMPVLKKGPFSVETMEDVSADAGQATKADLASTSAISTELPTSGQNLSGDKVLDLSVNEPESPGSPVVIKRKGRTATKPAAPKAAMVKKVAPPKKSAPESQRRSSRAKCAKK